MRSPGHDRVDVTVTVDRKLLDAVDGFVKEHPESNRSSVIGEALNIWLAARQKQAMIEQFSGEGAPEDELRAWRSIQSEAASRTFSD